MPSYIYMAIVKICFFLYFRCHRPQNMIILVQETPILKFKRLLYIFMHED